MAVFDIGSVVDMAKLAQGFDTNFVKPLAETISARVAGKADKDLQGVLEYDIKAMTFNVATVLAVAYAALALIGAMGLLKATLFIGCSLFIREIANNSLSVSKSDGLGTMITRLAAYAVRWKDDENWHPDYISWGSVCLIKNTTLSLSKQFEFGKKALFG